VTQDNPSISNAIANGAGSNNSAATNPASSWPAFSLAQPYMLNLNQTGGREVSANAAVAPVPGLSNQTVYEGPGLVNDLSLVNAWTWEDGRGVRCDFWRSVAALVPE